LAACKESNLQSLKAGRLITSAQQAPAPVYMENRHMKQTVLKKEGEKTKEDFLDAASFA